MINQKKVSNSSNDQPKIDQWHLLFPKKKQKQRNIQYKSLLIAYKKRKYMLNVDTKEEEKKTQTNIYVALLRSPSRTRSPFWVIVPILWL